mgnify:CR=1 FL=1
MHNKLIGICGWQGSGKDTAANFLIKNHGYERVSFATTLKDAIASIFHWPRHLLEGDTKESREWREQVDTWWAKRLDMPHLTPRWVLQNFGTEVMRKSFHDDIWIASLERSLEGKDGHYVISDVRFPNEVNMIRRLHGKMIHILRGPSPEWYAVEYEGYKDLQWYMTKYYPAVHPSEYSWILTNFDRMIRNDGTLEELEQEMDDLAY